MDPVKISGQGIIVARIVGETDDTLTLELAKNKTYQYKLSKDKSKNRFYTILFVRNFEGSLEPYLPPEMEGLAE